METTENKKEFSSIGLRIFIGTALIFAIQIGCQKLLVLLKPEWAENYDIMFAAVSPCPI